MAGPGVLFYLLYVLYILYFDLGQVQVESFPVEAPCAASASSPTMGSLLPLQHGRCLSHTLSLFYSLYSI
jgi:hypothetical protein